MKTYCPYTSALNDGAPATLFKINLDAGHGGASGRYDYLREIAFEAQRAQLPP